MYMIVKSIKLKEESIERTRCTNLIISRGENYLVLDCSDENSSVNWLIIINHITGSNQLVVYYPSLASTQEKG